MLKIDRKFLANLLIFAVSLVVSSSAFAWFFVIPGSLTRSISDAITGEEGFHCVGRAAKVGDVIQTSTGPGIVKSLSGESSRCSTNLNRPIRALLAPGEGALTADNKTVGSKPLTSMPPATSNARLELSDDWQQKPLVAGQDAKVIVLFAVNKTTNTALTLGTIK